MTFTHVNFQLCPFHLALTACLRFVGWKVDRLDRHCLLEVGWIEQLLYGCPLLNSSPCNYHASIGHMLIPFSLVGYRSIIRPTIPPYAHEVPQQNTRPTPTRKRQKQTQRHALRLIMHETPPLLIFDGD